MSEDSGKSGDVLGLRPFGESTKILTQAAVDGASAFLSRICLPAAEEFGLLLKDHVSAWRAENALKIAEKAERKIREFRYEHLRAHPRLVFQALEKGSWHDEDIFQEAWSGLLSSSCSDDGKDDSNTVFLNLLTQLTTTQVRIINFACEEVEKYISAAGWPYTKSLAISLDKLKKIAETHDVHKLDRELDYLRTLGLISPLGGGFSPESTEAEIQPTALALHLYVRCQGFVGSPIEYWKLQTEAINEIASDAQSGNM